MILKYSADDIVSALMGEIEIPKYQPRDRIYPGHALVGVLGKEDVNLLRLMSLCAFIKQVLFDKIAESDDDEIDEIMEAASRTEGSLRDLLAERFPRFDPNKNFCLIKGFGLIQSQCLRAELLGSRRLFLLKYLCEK